MERQVAEQGFSSGKEKFNPNFKKDKSQVKNPEEKKDIKSEIKQEKTETTQTQKPVKTEEKKEVKPEKIIKKELACVYGSDLPLSTKTSMAVCRFIKNKNPSQAIKALEQVTKLQIAIPFKGETPHRKGFNKGYARGRYPIKTSEYFIKLLKSVISNAKTNNLDTEKIRIVIAKADKASSPVRGTRMGYGRKRFKRANIYIEVREKTNSNKTKDNKQPKAQHQNMPNQTKAHDTKQNTHTPK
jgi:large subunit ribosomal protein L22